MLLLLFVLLHSSLTHTLHTFSQRLLQPRPINSHRVKIRTWILVFSLLFCCRITELCYFVVWEKEHTRIWKRMWRVRGRKVNIMVKWLSNSEHTHEYGIKDVLWGFSSTASIHQSLCFWTICCLFVPVVSINKPIYDIILRFLPFSLFNQSTNFATDKAKTYERFVYHDCQHLTEWEQQGSQNEKKFNNSKFFSSLLLLFVIELYVSPMLFTHSISKIAKYNNK